MFHSAIDAQNMTANAGCVLVPEHAVVPKSFNIQQTQLQYLSMHVIKAITGSDSCKMTVITVMMPRSAVLAWVQASHGACHRKAETASACNPHTSTIYMLRHALMSMAATVNLLCISCMHVPPQQVCVCADGPALALWGCQQAFIVISVINA